MTNRILGRLSGSELMVLGFLLTVPTSGFLFAARLHMPVSEPLYTYLSIIRSMCLSLISQLHSSRVRTVCPLSEWMYNYVLLRNVEHKWLFVPVPKMTLLRTGALAIFLYGVYARIRRAGIKDPCDIRRNHDTRQVRRNFT